DIETIGAGGGSIAWIDRGGLLRVGPRSAGAEPGPIAYGRGGSEPTITDAQLVLGRLSPEYFLGGRMELDREAALAAYAALGEALELDAHQAALAALMIADEEMANAIRLVAVEYGLDAREFALVAAGGAGPLHARSVAARLGIETILIPPAPGLCSAFGALIAPPRVDRIQTYFANSESLDPVELMGAIGRLAEDAEAELGHSVELAEPVLECFASLRYAGQNFELEVEVPGAGDGSWEQLLESFAAEHERQYGFDLPGEPVEVVNLRATARQEQEPLALTDAPGEAAPARSRSVWLGGDGPSEVAVRRRSELAAGERVEGPVIIEEDDSTTVAFAGDSIVVDPSGVLVLRMAER
ncbi:MAG: hydantoinase/oxoprolinase family protein, partial [Actinobacteria bacterium]|nr:hydantoinase/oxoprolinase family protein [Actinomycetota bacterium]